MARLDFCLEHAVSFDDCVLTTNEEMPGSSRLHPMQTPSVEPDVVPSA